MGFEEALTSLAGRVIDPVEREEAAGHFALEKVLDRQVQLIHVLNDQMDLIEQETGRNPPGSV